MPAPVSIQSRERAHGRGSIAYHLYEVWAMVGCSTTAWAAAAVLTREIKKGSMELLVPGLLEE